MSKKIDRTKGRRFGKKNTGRIYERNPMTGKIRSRVPGDYGNETEEIIKSSRKITTSAQTAISRSEILDEIWAADKLNKDGKWYVSLSDVCAILGEDYASKEEKVTYPEFVEKHYKKDDAGKDQ